MVRYAVVGAGWISQEAFLPAVHLTGNSTVAALVSGNPTTAQHLADFHGIPKVVPYSMYDALVASDDVDAVYIALPNSMHADFAIRALKAGKHVMVEKPLAISLAESRGMIAAAGDSGAFLMTAYRLHNEPATLAVLEMVRQGKIGLPLYVSSTFAFQTQLGNHRLKAGHWGGPLQDLGVYCLNAARHIFAMEPTAVQAMASRPTGDPRFDQIDASLAVTLTFPEGRLAQFFCSFGAYLSEQYRVLGSAGEILVDPAYRFESALSVTLRTAEGQTRQDFPHCDHFAGQIAYFSECITAGTPPVADGAEGLADMRVLLAIEEAAITGQTVTLDPHRVARHPTPDMERRFPPANRKLLLGS